MRMDRRPEGSRPSSRSTGLQEWDDHLVREPLPRGPRDPQPLGKSLILSALAVLLVVTVVGTTALVIRDLRLQSQGTTNPAAHASATATVTMPPSPTRVPADPKANGWTQFTPNVYSGDVAFAQSGTPRGYLCGQGPDTRLFATTTDGGKTWHPSSSPAQFTQCTLHVSPANPLDVVLTSHEGSFGSDSPATTLDSHYSTDGGKTWKTAPIPSGTRASAGAVWSGPYLYAWTGPSQYGPQANALKVSANGEGFVSIDPSKLLPDAQGVAIQGAVAGSGKLYLNLGYSCSALQSCQAIVASQDGGKTWAQIPNKTSIQLAYVAGTTLYGLAPDPQDPKSQIEMTTSDNGTSWTPLKLPPIPGTLPTASAPVAAPAADGTLFAAPDGLGVAYYRTGAWTTVPFSSQGVGLRVAVSVDVTGKPNAMCMIDDGNDYQAGIYWHALP